MVVYNDFRWNSLRLVAGTVKGIQLSSGYSLEVWWIVGGHFEVQKACAKQLIKSSYTPQSVYNANIDDGTTSFIQVQAAHAHDECQVKKNGEKFQQLNLRTRLTKR